MSITWTAGKLLWPGTGLLVTLAVLWEAGHLGWPAVATAPAKGPPADGRGDRPPAPGRVIAEGRLVTYPGAEVVVGTELTGTIVDLPVREKSVVRRGDLIAEIRSDDLRAMRAEALARIAEAQADIGFFEREIRRVERLQARSAGTQSELDGHRRNLESSRARRDAAIASRDRYDALIAKTRITAPIDGVIIARFAQPGETVAAATRLVTVADLARVRVEAEVDEYDVGRVALGAHAKVLTEGFPGVTWRGTVEEIPDAVVARHLRPEDPGRPTDTRVLLVKIALDEPTSLKLGQRVEVEIVRESPLSPTTREESPD